MVFRLFPLLLLCFSIFFSACQTSSSEAISASTVVSSDIQNFWEAYDAITATQDSARQYRLINELFIDKGTPGLEGIMWARRYTDQSYVEAINSFPKYWESVRKNLLKAPDYAAEIADGVDRFKKLYPEMRPAKIYFTVGAFRTSGTTIDSMVCIGSEMALADAQTDVSELPESMNYVKEYLKTDPVSDIVFLNVHEYVHTQQNNHEYNLLNRCVYEGIAEFVAVQAMEQASSSPAMAYGKDFYEEVKAQFVKELFNTNTYNWLYNNDDNIFGVTNMGYFVGYEIAELYYKKAEDKQKAIKTMIELDFAPDPSFDEFVDASGYLPGPVDSLRAVFEENRPRVVRIAPFENGSQELIPGKITVTVEFSEPMNKGARGFDFGPLGDQNVMRVENFLGFSEDGKLLSFETTLQPDKQHQVLLTSRFMSQAASLPLKPYLIDVKTQ